MYFFTEQDPNFRIKGSRDPLGFQPIWQNLGRNVVKHLSTVSNSLIDFQVLSYAWYFFADNDPKDFMKFFYKFEQACAFARGLYLKNDRFNGIDFVRKNLSQETFRFSRKDEILSNQKSYGIFGKYNRPFTAMKIAEHPNFKNIIREALQSKVNFPDLQQMINRLLQEEVVSLRKDELQIIADILDPAKVNNPEMEFYTETILKTNSNHVQNELFNLLEENPELTKVEFDLFGFIAEIQKKNISDELQSYVELIRNAEQVLCPYVYLFKTLQTCSSWTKENVSQEEIFTSFPTQINYHFQNEIIAELNRNLSKSPFEIAEMAVNRNKQVSENRNNVAWMNIENNKIMVSYSDGAHKRTTFDAEAAFEHNYFLPAYISLYNQIRNTNG